MNIMIGGWYGIGNGGDEAILRSMLTAFDKKVPSSEISILSFNPQETRRLTADMKLKPTVYKIGEKFQVFQTDFRKIRRAIKKADLVMIGGGGMIQDVYNWYTIPFFSFIALLSKILGKPTMFYAVGVGPINRKFSKKLAQIIGNQIDLITVRDNESKKELVSLGVSKDKIHVTADPVFALEPATSKRAIEILCEEGINKENKLTIGISVREVSQWSKLNKKNLAEVIDHLAKRTGAKIVFIPIGHYTNKWLGPPTEPTDLETSVEISSIMQYDASIIRGTYNPQELMAIIGQMDLMISMRLHGLIMAAAMNVPLISISYEQETKLKSLLELLNQSHNFFRVENLNRDEFVKYVESVLFQRKTIKNYLREKTYFLREEAMRTLDLAMKCKLSERVSIINVLSFLSVLIFGSTYYSILNVLNWLGSKFYVFRVDITKNILHCGRRQI